MSKTQPSEIDRLIELASDERPRPSPVTEIPLKKSRALSLADSKDSQPAMWRVLLQLRPLLPHLARALPLLERGILGTNVLSNVSAGPPKADTTHFEASLSGLRDANSSLKLQLKNQASEIELLEEQVKLIRQSLATGSLQREEMAAAIASLRRIVLVCALVGVVLIAALTAWILLHPPQ